jgi:hypothetical protein
MGNDDKDDPIIQAVDETISNYKPDEIITRRDSHKKQAHPLMSTYFSLTPTSQARGAYRYATNYDLKLMTHMLHR